MISRRKFIQLTSAASAYLVVGCMSDAQGNKNISAGLTDDPSKIDLNQFISIGKDGSITLFNHRPEMGQGTYQSIPMILAEELEVSIDEVEIKQSAADREIYGSQMVVGSRSIQTEFEKLRMMGATARELLKQAAANRWKVDIRECKAVNGTVVAPSGDILDYGELVEDAGKLQASQDSKLKAPSEFKVIGTPVPRRDIPLKTNGEAVCKRDSG